MGRMEIHDKEHSGYSSDSVNDETIAIVQTLLSNEKANCYQYFQEDRSTFLRECKQNICKPYSPKWTLHEVGSWLLTNKHHAARMGDTLEFLNCYHTDGNRFFKQIITCDKTWVHFWMPDSKQASKVWKKKEEEAPRKCKEVPFMGKVLTMVF